MYIIRLFLPLLLSLSFVCPTALGAAATNNELVVAVIDTGADIQHELLANHVWENPGESGVDDNGMPRGENGIDDDGNGHIDDQFGWNFASHSNDVSDTSGHGTHVAGIIAQQVSNGPAPAKRQFKIMVLKYYDAKRRSHSIGALAQSIEYAVNMGASIINISAGGRGPNEKELKALKLALKSKRLVVAASGNKSPSAQSARFYPAAYDLQNVLSVAAINSRGNILKTSNYDPSYVDAIAPGLSVYSSLPGNSYGRLSGTSQAAAYASGVAAYILTRQQYASPDRLKSLLTTAQPNTQQTLSDRVKRAVNLTKLNLLTSINAFDAANRQPASQGDQDHTRLSQ